VIIKPHPATILPIAISVAVFRDVLAAAGFDPNLVTLAVDTVADPIGIALVKHPATAIVDFTGSVRFGSWIERNAAPALAFTETAGVNTVVLHSCEDMEAVARSLATTLCLYSAQMCTSPQNIYIPREGVRVGAGDAARMMPFVDVADAIAGAVRKLTADPKRAAAIMGSIQSPATLDLIGEMAAGCATRGAVLLAPEPFVNPEFPAARTSTPLIARLTTAERDIYAEERFGPIAFVIETADADDALAQATGDVATSGGLTAFLYSTDPAYVERAERAYARAGAQLTINLTGPMPLNFAAAYSDYHVTGLNPAGNAALTDLAFVTSRFLVAQSRQPA
jgi:phenylacetic acid degradation protein paaN